MLTKEDLENQQKEYDEEASSSRFTLKKNPRQMLEELRDKTGQERNPLLYLTLIQEEYEEFLASDNDENCLKEVADLVYVLYGFTESMGWDLDEALQRVHKNNLGRVLQDDGTVLRREDGKIIKNPNAPKIDLSDLVQKETNPRKDT